jgi:hypothetical protein
MLLKANKLMVVKYARLRFAVKRRTIFLLNGSYNIGQQIVTDKAEATLLITSFHLHQQQADRCIFWP